MKNVKLTSKECAVVRHVFQCQLIKAREFLHKTHGAPGLGPEIVDEIVVLQKIMDKFLCSK